MAERQRFVLIVEDDPTHAELALEVFREPAAWETAWVEDGAEALDYLFRKRKHVQARRPDLVLLNLNLPKVKGHGVLERMKQCPQLARIPVVMWAVSTSEEGIERAYRHGAAGYLTKSPLRDETCAGLRAVRSFWERCASPEVPASGRDLPPG